MSQSFSQFLTDGKVSGFALIIPTFPSLSDHMPFKDIIKVIIPGLFVIGNWIASAPFQEFTQKL